jgi:hypothetical protein
LKIIKYAICLCTNYKLNLKDWANVDVNAQNTLFENAKKKLNAVYSNVTTFLRMTGSEALGHIDDNELDYIFIDARHDYCATKEDLISK